MSKFRPSVFYIAYGKAKTITYPSYAELRKWIAAHVSESDEGEVTVTRSRRGQWGEWFEKWTLKRGRSVKTREGWM